MARVRNDDPGSRPPSAAEAAFVEEAALVYEKMGLPRMAGRILGWLLICEPAEQALPDLAVKLKASKASMSTMTRLLERAGIVGRKTLPGDRRDHVFIPPDVASRSLEEVVARMHVVRSLAERGLELLGGASDARTARLRDLHDTYVFLETETAATLGRWQARKAGATAAKAPKNGKAAKGGKARRS